MINIYIIVNSINNKIYIGQTSRSIQVRFAEHMRDPESGVFSDVIKYGRSIFTYKLLHTCKSEFADQWEHYYICKYDSTNPEYGYNRVSDRAFRWKVGGDNPSQTLQGKERIRRYNKEHQDSVTRGFKEYNNSRKFPVGMLDDCGNIIMKFESLLSACRYLNKPACGTTRIKNVCDRVNAYGKRYRFYGHAWTALNKNVQTNSVDECRMDDELPFE